MKQEVASFLDYVAHSPTVFQATQQACDMLDAAGFTRLSEHEAWEILPGGRYYVTRNRSALVAFAVPENGFTHCQIVDARAGEEFLVRAPDARGGAVVEKQVAGHDVLFLCAGLRGDFGGQCALRVLAAEEREHVRLRVVAVAAVDVAVEVDRHVRNQRRVAVKVDQPGDQPALSLIHI